MSVSVPTYTVTCYSLFLKKLHTVLIMLGLLAVWVTYLKYLKYDVMNAVIAAVFFNTVKL